LRQIVVRFLLSGYIELLVCSEWMEVQLSHFLHDFL